MKYDTSGVWGGNPGCEHEWISQQNHKDNLRFRDPNHIASVGNNKNAEIFADPTVLSGNCSKCGAWKGQLGLEPTYQMYIDHLMLVMKELKRVLKKTGTLFWNMGDTYSGSGGALPSPSEYMELKTLLNLPNDHDYEMLNTVKILVDDSGSKEIPIGFKPLCKCNADFEPGTVLDSFAGSGTVGVVAMKQEKNAILVEISPEYCNIIKKRLNWGVGLGVEYEHVVGEAPK